MAGLKSYIVPTSSYDHHWSGSIRALREINFYEKAETAGEILLRNRLLFLNKWRGIAGHENKYDLLESGFIPYVTNHAQNLAVAGHFDEAQKWIDIVTRLSKDNTELESLQRFIDILASKTGTST